MFEASAFLGKEVPLDRYMELYEEWIRLAVAVFVTETKTKKLEPLIQKELSLVEADCFRFKESHGRFPDYKYLDRKVLQFKEKFYSYQEFVETQVSEEEFVDNHIRMLKNFHLLTSFKFSENYEEVVRAEKVHAKRMYQENNVYLAGYEEEVISRSRSTRRLTLRKLKERFINEYGG